MTNAQKKMVQRSISGLVLSLVFIIAIFIYRPLFYWIFGLVAYFMLREWYNMTWPALIETIVGFIAIPIAIASILIISIIDSAGVVLALYFCTIWSVDVMAMVGGKLIGGKKLAPRISPNKTISGLLCGVISAIISTYLLRTLLLFKLKMVCLPVGNMLFQLSDTSFALLIMLLGFVSQASDLSVSIFKRRFGVKDTGTIIPGHGGVLDRFDSIILTAPVVAILLLCSLVKSNII